jgi:hypothetical protein
MPDPKAFEAGNAPANYRILKGCRKISARFQRALQRENYFSSMPSHSVAG